MVGVLVLGEVVARVDGRSVDLGPAKQRCVLAALALEVGRVVPVDRLVEAVWGADAPRRPRETLATYVSRLRQLLAPARIERRSGGYVLVLDEDAVDLHRFRALRGKDVAEAVALWRGDPLTGLEGAWAEGERQLLREERLRAECDLTDERLHAGEGEQLVAELAARVAEHPLDERVVGQYMVALYRAGRVGDALEEFRLVRARLVEELGADPGRALRDLHQRILAADPALDARTVVVPRQLPAPPPRFTGRAGELAALTEALDERGTVVISAIAGTGGIGKTWLALHWAHRHADRFPDGQLFVDLQGFSPTAPLDPGAALRGLLTALGVEPRDVPADLAAQSGLYRSVLADKRVLVVLDNARDAAQVVPLLPGSPGCAVLITSRNRLTEVVARHGARPLALDVLGAAESREVLVSVLGEREDVDDLAARCHGFPLALGLVAGRAAANPWLPLGALAASLRDDPGALDDDNPAASLPAVLSWSVEALSTEQARAFTLLGLAPGADFGLHAAASLTGLPVPAARAVLRALEDAHLVRQHAPGRWSMHDLVKLYAARDVTDRAALTRVVDHYLHTAFAADRLLDPHRVPIELGECTGVPLELPDEAAALSWFEAEHANLPAVQRVAADEAVWRLAWSMDNFLVRRGHLVDSVLVWRAGVAAADRLGDPVARTLAYRRLGTAAGEAGLHKEALARLHSALELVTRTGDRQAEAHIRNNLAGAYERQGRPADALEHVGEALRLYRELELPIWEAYALNALGWLQAKLGSYEPARASCLAALELARRQSYLNVQANILDSLGFIDHQTGRYEEALARFEEALALCSSLGETYSAANTLDRMGETYRVTGEVARARGCWERALEGYRAQGRARDVERVEGRLAALG
ncbi:MULTISPECIES: AfsR/SARP family transcriptional regulator [unclassified Saccharothrix]|uniref:AfsR/SARP family transcriptional regulator n=1 Tax=unclassified Saccharothrix TaxID=2593673 RepID=UPI00307E099A